MQSIADKISLLRSEVPHNVVIVAVSKTKPPALIMEAYASGQRDFGENRVQELLSKKDMLPSDIRWHLIGHLQSNKVKYIAPFISMIQSVDSYKLLSAIDREAVKAGRKIECLLQIHIAAEETKFGFSMNELKEMLDDKSFYDLNNVVIRGVMGMATFTDDFALVRSEFRQLREHFEELRQNYFNDDPGFREISMGMSGDYLTAIEEGSTIIRVGSLIFGER